MEKPLVRFLTARCNEKNRCEILCKAKSLFRKKWGEINQIFQIVEWIASASRLDKVTILFSFTVCQQKIPSILYIE